MSSLIALWLKDKIEALQKHMEKVHVTLQTLVIYLAYLFPRISQMKKNRYYFALIHTTRIEKKNIGLREIKFILFYFSWQKITQLNK
jgi:hypothetical protein